MPKPTIEEVTTKLLDNKLNRDVKTPGKQDLSKYHIGCTLELLLAKIIALINDTLLWREESFKLD